MATPRTGRPAPPSAAAVATEVTGAARPVRPLRAVVRLGDGPPPARVAAVRDAFAAWARQYEVETAGVVRAAAVRAELGPHDVAFADLALFVPARNRCRPAGDPSRLTGPPDLMVVVEDAGPPGEARGRRNLLNSRYAALADGGVTELLSVSVSPTGGGEVQWFRTDPADPRRPHRGGGYLKSAALPGLWLPENVLEGPAPPARLTAAVRAGCGTLDHALFVNGLCTARKPR